MSLSSLFDRFDRFERAFLASEGAVIDVQLAKLMCFFIGMAVATVAPDAVGIGWLIAAALLLAIRPFATAGRLMLEELRSFRQSRKCDLVA